MMFLKKLQFLIGVVVPIYRRIYTPASNQKLPFYQSIYYLSIIHAPTS